MDIQKLKERLLEYKVHAEKLESSRCELVRAIIELAEAEIIPLVAKRLPEDYSVDTKKIEVDGMEPHYGVSSKFGLSLRLMHNNRPIFGEDDRTFDLRRSLEPFCEELTKKYGLENIGVYCEPEHM